MKRLISAIVSTLAGASPASDRSMPNTTKSINEPSEGTLLTPVADTGYEYALAYAYFNGPSDSTELALDIYERAEAAEAAEAAADRAAAA